MFKKGGGGQTNAEFLKAYGDGIELTRSFYQMFKLKGNGWVVSKALWTILKKNCRIGILGHSGTS